MLKYQSMLCENPHIWLEVVKTLNLANLLPVDSAPLEHNCIEVMDEFFLSWPDLTNQPISHPDIEYFTDGGSFVQDSMFFAEHAIVSLDLVIEACPLLIGTSAQKAELVALMQALQLAVGVQVNIYTDSKYTFTTIHVPGALYKERGIINLGGKIIKYGQETFKLLDAVWVLKQVAVIYQKGDTIAQGNQNADKKAALIKGPAPMALMSTLFPYPLAAGIVEVLNPKGLRAGMKKTRQDTY
jgi:ribonuclease HI